LLQPQLGPGPAESPPPGFFPEIIAPGGGIPGGISGDACRGCCDQQENSWWSGTFGAGAGGAYLFPYFSSNPAFFTSTAVGARTVNNQQNFGTTGNGAPVAFISYTLDSGLGIQSNYFSFHNSNSQNATFNGAASLTDPAGTLFGTPANKAFANAYSELNMLVINLELTQKWVFGNCMWMRIGAGVEYAHIDQNYALNLFNGGTGNTASTINHGFTGWGPTISLEIHRRLGDTDFGVYGTARGTLLFGSVDQNYQFISTNAPVQGSSNSNLVMPVGELELGVEWGHCWGRLRVYGQLGVNGQIWGNGGNASEGGPLGGNFANQSSSPANFGLIGGVGRVGIEF